MEERTNVIKVKFLRAGQPSGRAYTYFTPEPVEVGDLVDIAILSEDSKSQGIVTAVNVPMAEIEAFKDRAKTIVGKAEQQPQEQTDKATEGNKKPVIDI